MPEENKQDTLIHGTYLFNVHLITVYLMHGIYHIQTQKTMWMISVELIYELQTFLLQCLWIILNFFLSVQVQLTEGYY